MRLLLLSIILASALAPACKVDDPPPIEETWKDDFERSEIGKNYRPTSDVYEIVNGALKTQGAKNHPLWLRKKLPDDVAIEFDCWSNSPDGDIKVELFGDGESYDEKGGQYTSTGYVAVMGGWNNSKSILARGNEHGTDLVERRRPRVEKGKRYHWRIERRGDQIDWYVDDMDEPFLSLKDAERLEGDGHEYFAFNNWQSDAWFDNLVISPL